MVELATIQVDIARTLETQLAMQRDLATLTQAVVAHADSVNANFRSLGLAWDRIVVLLERFLENGLDSSSSRPDPGR